VCARAHACTLPLQIFEHITYFHEMWHKHYTTQHGGHTNSWGGSESSDI